MAVSSYFLCPQCTAYLNYNKNNRHKLEYSRQIIALVRQLTVHPSATPNNHRISQNKNPKLFRSDQDFCKLWGEIGNLAKYISYFGYILRNQYLTWKLQREKNQLPSKYIFSQKKQQRLLPNQRFPKFETRSPNLPTGPGTKGMTMSKALPTRPNSPSSLAF